MAGVELWRSFAAASAVVERRQASALRSARAAPKRGSWTTRLPAFRLPSFFSCFLLFFLALRAWIGMKGRTPPPASLHDRSKADVSCRFRAACRTPRMPTASRERWCLVLPPDAFAGGGGRRCCSNGFASLFGKASVVQDKEEGGLKCVFGRLPWLAEFSWRCVATWREAIPTNAGMRSITIIRPRATFPVRCAITDGACPTAKVTMTALRNSRRCIPPRTILNPRCRNIKINALIDARNGLSARDRRTKG